MTPNTTKRFFLTILCCFVFLTFFAQKDIPKEYFRSPIGIPIYLAGNFGELRSNHFHSGIDIKTKEKEGYRIYAAADGVISRIRISPYGYGRVIYIDHPNGYTTVYAHLRALKGEIAEWIKQEQYKAESWEIDIYPADSGIVFRVKKGDVVALSGNSGRSGGPHLHFEVRETESEFPVNPLLFGFDIVDNIPPIIKSIAIYPLNDTSYINGTNSMRRFSVSNINGSYQISSKAPINVYGEIGIGIETIDKLNGTGNRNGIYSIQLSLDNKVIYLSEMEKFAFDESRYINSLIDYSTKLIRGIRIQKSFIEPNNQLSIYKICKKDGQITISENRKLPLNYLVKDTYGNESSLSFSLNGSIHKKSINSVLKAKGDTVFNYHQENIFTSQTITVTIPKNVLYDDIPFSFMVSDTIKNAITPTYHIHNEYTPLHDYITVSIKAGRLNEGLRDKSIIVFIGRNNKISSLGGSWRKNQITTESKKFGKYAIMIDTIAPKIIPINISPNKNMSKSSSIIVRIGDNLSGIESYKGSIDGKWILMEYDAKNSRLIYQFEGVSSNKHLFKLELEDAVGNYSSVEIPFFGRD